ncbi:MAG: tRNA epoxyqueuosine(34) reductase QueG [Chloroflexi bacterium]|nr:tRNA epoxyqueuosine(34) reductase QueG [Chloroflexota bacterium]
MSLTADIKEHALELGFDQVGITGVQPFTEASITLAQRIEQGLLGGMPWFTQERAQIATDPRRLLPSAQSIISLALSYPIYGSESEPSYDQPQGKLSRYAWGRDYHQAMREKMKALASYIKDKSLTPWEGRLLVDSTPLIEKAIAQRSGIGWYGKNTLILTTHHSSWVFLGEILTNQELEIDRPRPSHCGPCQACLSACPTRALIAPYVLDSRRCLSYLTVEHEGSIPYKLRPLFGQRILGCDVCQEVCPENQGVRPVEKEVWGRAISTLPLIPLLSLREEEFRQRFHYSAVKRATRQGLQRNAAVALGNSGDRAAISALAQALAEAKPLVRGHAAWALGRLGGKRSRQFLERALTKELDEDVKEEIVAALNDGG